MSTQELDQAAKKAVLRLVSYGLYAVTAEHAGARNAFTANWLTQVSFEPPLLALSVERDSFSLGLIVASGSFAVHVLEASQRELAGRLGKRHAVVGDKLAGLRCVPAPVTGAPLLPDDTLGYLECRVRDRLEAGDSILFLAEVVGAGVFREGEPLSMRAAGFRHAG
jgi:flavin reductase (DIM6/NTAB) family NADH-FMN oxidoreductase RutF